MGPRMEQCITDPQTSKALQSTIVVTQICRGLPRVSTLPMVPQKGTPMVAPHTTHITNQITRLLPMTVRIGMLWKATKEVCAPPPQSYPVQMFMQTDCYLCRWYPWQHAEGDGTSSR